MHDGGGGLKWDFRWVEAATACDTCSEEGIKTFTSRCRALRAAVEVDPKQANETVHSDRSNDTILS